MYQLIKNQITGEMAQGIKRVVDAAFIPKSEDNADYQQFLAWLEAGNTVLPADEPSQGA